MQVNKMMSFFMLTGTLLLLLFLTLSFTGLRGKEGFGIDNEDDDELGMYGDGGIYGGESDLIGLGNEEEEEEEQEQEYVEGFSNEEEEQEEEQEEEEEYIEGFSNEEEEEQEEEQEGFYKFEGFDNEEEEEPEEEEEEEQEDFYNNKEGFQGALPRLRPENSTGCEKILDIFSQVPGALSCNPISSQLHNSRGGLCLTDEHKKILQTRGGNATLGESQIGF